MIIGVGTDLIEIGRVRKACEKQAFLSRVYTEEECRADFSGAIRDEILDAIQNLFHSKVVYGITLSNVKYGG